MIRGTALVIVLCALASPAWTATVHVQFSDPNATKIIAVFAAPQDPAVYPNQGDVDTTDPRYLAFVSPPPSPAQAYNAAVATQLALGYVLTSTGTAALNGTYAVDVADYQQLIGAWSGISAAGAVPGGGSTFNYPDAAGAAHAFTAGDFTAFGKKVYDYEYEVYQAALCLFAQPPCQTPTWPSNAGTIP